MTPPARRPMPIASWRRRCSRMGSGKRASMREGPLAALFRKTETEGLEAPHASGQPDSGPRTPTPQERLRHAFSSDLPENMMSPPEHEPAPAATSPAYYP